MAYSVWPHGLQHARFPCPSPSPRVCSDSCLSSQWCHPTISSPVISFSSVLNLSQYQGLFQWALHIRWPKDWNFNFKSVLSMNIQGWFPLRLTGLIFLWSMGFSRIFCSTTVWNYQLFITQPSGLCKIQVMVADPVIISSALILVLFIYLNHYSVTEIDCVPSIASDPSL